jgi:ribonuclease HII
VKQSYPAPGLTRELDLWDTGYKTVGGVDEAGRGSWAGPVYAAVVVFSPQAIPSELIGHVRDSKQLSAGQRQKLAEAIKKTSLEWGIGQATNHEIDSLGIVQATKLAAKRAIGKLKIPPEFLMLDYLILEELTIPQIALVHGDQQILSIAAASILAKTGRDHCMLQMDALYPAYSFKTNKGYGTPAHQHALKRVGVCPIHRVSFKPVLAINQTTR